jgi:hypothetical protein
MFILQALDQVRPPGRLFSGTAKIAQRQRDSNPASRRTLAVLGGHHVVSLKSYDEDDIQGN